MLNDLRGGAIASTGLNSLNMAMQQKEQAMKAEYVSPTRRQRLQSRKEEYEKALQFVNAAIETLDNNPDLEAVMNLLEAADRF